MLYKLRVKWLLICFFVVCIGKDGYCQNSLEGFNFHALVLNSFGKVVPNKNVDVNINIYFDSLKTMLAYGEKHSTITNKFGLFTLIVGQGLNTYAGIDSNFTVIDWATGNYFLNVQIDTTSSSSFIDLGITKMVSVPYALYSESVSGIGNTYFLDKLADADTSGIQLSYVLKWNGSLWVPSKDNFSDTVNYANSINHTIYSDTAQYALNTGILPHPATVLFAFHSDSSSYSNNTNYADSSSHSIYCDTAAYALSVAPSWSIIGNASVASNSFLGTGDNKNFEFRTNSASNLFLSSVGLVGINNSSPQASLHIISNDPFIQEGVFGSIVSAPSGSGTRMLWSPAKGAFRAGYVIGNKWDIDSLGNYSFVAGYDNKASGNNTAGGNFSLAFGSNNIVAAGGSIIFGANNAITQNNLTTYGSNLALGSNNLLTSKRQVAIGNSNVVSGGSSATIGTNNSNGGNINTVIGYKCIAGSGSVSVAIGYYANTNSKNGSFVFSDASSDTYTNSLVDNDFTVRASGGTVFFTDPDTTMGVYLASGSGSWSSISNRNKKENFISVDDEEVLQKVYHLKISKWKYKTEKEAFHIGPIAQDMYKQFHLGESPESITMTDIDGVILSCIKALNKKINLVSEKYNELNSVSSETESLKVDFDELDKRLNFIEKKW